MYAPDEDHAHHYNRDRFGYDDEWDADACYTHKEVLIRGAVRLDKVSKSCAVYGTWRSVYDNKLYTDNDLQIDHLVPLAEAWHSGAYAWSHKRQIAFGNDLDYKWDLQAVFYTDNQNKQDFEPGQWMPAKNHCTYVKAWIAVKARWGLSVDPAERAVLARKLDHCSSAKVLNPGKPNVEHIVGTGGPLR